jgi:hypothetical protein
VTNDLTPYRPPAVMVATVLVGLVLLAWLTDGNWISLLASIVLAVLSLGVGVALGMVGGQQAGRVERASLAADVTRLQGENTALMQSNTLLRKIETEATDHARAAESRARGYQMSIADCADRLTLTPAVPPFVVAELRDLLPGEVPADV